MKKITGYMTIASFILIVFGFSSSFAGSVKLPKDTVTRKYEKLGYVEQEDDILAKNYKYLAYKEIDKRKPGKWSITISGSETAGTKIRMPLAGHMKRRLAKANLAGKSYIVFGFDSLKGTSFDPRLVQTRVHHVKGKATKVTFHLSMRTADNKSKKEKVIEIKL